MNSYILIVGATSGIGRAVAHEYARHGHHLILAGRSLADLEATAADIALRYGVNTLVRRFEALDFASHRAFIAQSPGAEAGELAGLIVCHGYLGDQARAQSDLDEALTIVDTNFTSCVSLLHAAAHYFEKQERGFICALSSVAGDRGRQSNYVYGAAKGALSLFLQGLRNRLHRAGVRIVTVKPGFVDTAMTYGILQDGLLVSRPDQIARAVYRGVARGAETIYAPWFWAPIMLIIRLIPERLFKRLRL